METRWYEPEKVHIPQECPTMEIKFKAELLVENRVTFLACEHLG